MREWFKEEFEKIHNEIEKEDELSHYLFLRIRNFKSNLASKESDKHIRQITKEAFKLAKEDKIKEAIEKLRELDGVAIPTASTILAMKFPNKFAIIDIRVIKSLKKEEWLRGNKYMNDSHIYEDYLILMRQNAREKNMGLRDYERSLWEKDS